MSSFASLDDIAAHLSTGVLPGDPPRIVWRRSSSSPVVHIYWDDARGLVWISAPLGIDATQFDPRDLASAVAAINVRLEVLGIEYDEAPVFVSHVFFDADGKVSARAIERLLVAVDECAAQASVVFAGLTPREKDK